MSGGDRAESHGEAKKIDADSDSGWRAVAAEVSGAEEAYSFVGVLPRLIRHPISEAVQLAEDPHYRGHVSFFSTCFAAWLGFGLVVLPAFVGWYTGEDLSGVDTKAAALALTILQYIEIAVAVPLGFYLYRLGAQIQRTPKAYAKFALLGGGLALLLSVAMQAARVLGIVAIRRLFDEETGLAIVNAPWLIALVNVAMFAGVVVLAMVLNKAFWRLRWRFVIPVALAISVIDVGVLLAAIRMMETPPFQAVLNAVS